MAIKIEPDVEAVLSIRVRGREMKTIPLAEALEWLAMAYKESDGDIPRTIESVKQDIRGLLRRV